MTEELDILKVISESPDISQRKIAEKTGISLGQVNFLIKKCVKKGLLKLEGQTTKSIRYNLTPKGLAEKTALTLEYIKLSYGAVNALTDKIKALSEQYGGKGMQIYVYGSRDEMYEIVKLSLGTDRISYLVPEHVECLKELIGEDTSGKVIFYWESEKKHDLEGYNAVNILEKIV